MALSGSNGCHTPNRIKGNSWQCNACETRITIMISLRSSAVEQGRVCSQGKVMSHKESHETVRTNGGPPGQKGENEEGGWRVNAFTTHCTPHQCLSRCTIFPCGVSSYRTRSGLISSACAACSAVSTTSHGCTTCQMCAAIPGACCR